MNGIEYACERAKSSGNKDFEVHILLDFNRGSRGGEVSSRTMLTPLLERFEGMVHVSLYHTPDLSGYLKQYLPPKLDETVGVQHMKVYLFDDSLVMSGWVTVDANFVVRIYIMYIVPVLKSIHTHTRMQLHMNTLQSY